MLTIATAFGPDRLWTLPLWHDTVKQLDWPNELELVITDNTCRDSNTDIVAMLNDLNSKRWVLLTNRTRLDRQKSSEAIANHLADMWNRTIPCIDTEATLSLEADVRPMPGTLAALGTGLSDNTPIVGAVAHSRKGHIMAYALKSEKPWQVIGKPPPSAAGVTAVGSVSLCCTMIQTAFLHTVRFAGVTSGRAGHEFSIMRECCESGRKVLCDFDHPARHYRTATEYV